MRCCLSKLNYIQWAWLGIVLHFVKRCFFFYSNFYENLKKNIFFYLIRFVWILRRTAEIWTCDQIIFFSIFGKRLLVSAFLRNEFAWFTIHSHKRTHISRAPFSIWILNSECISVERTCMRINYGPNLSMSVLDRVLSVRLHEVGLFEMVKRMCKESAHAAHIAHRLFNIIASHTGVIQWIRSISMG